MARGSLTDMDYKLTILFSLEQLGPVTDTQLLDFLTGLDLMGYFEMRLNLAEMEDNGQVALRAGGADTLVAITEEGRAVLAFFEKRIPMSRREAVAAAAPEKRRDFRTARSTPKDTFRLRDGRVCVRLRMMEDDSPLMDILLPLSREEASSFGETDWTRSAGDFLRTAMLRLGEGRAEGETPRPLPDGAQLESAGGGNWLLSLGTPERDPMSLVFLLPDEALARHWAAAWPACRDELYRVLRGLLFPRRPGQDA